MMTRASFPEFLKKTKPALPASRMKSKSRKGLGADMSEGGVRGRSFIAKPSRKKFLKP